MAAATAPAPVDNTPVLRALEFGVILLLWLFFMWVVRAVWVEVRPLKRKRRRGKDVDPVVDGKRRRAAAPARHPARRPVRTGLRRRRGGHRGPGPGLRRPHRLRLATPRTSTPGSSASTATCGSRTSGSTNGTWVNTVRIEERTKLQKGDLLQVGGTVFEVGR